MAEIALINPRFDPSYWGLDYALPLLRKRAAMPVAALPLLAALTPGRHRITIVDENVESIDFDRLTQADLVGLTGMSVQRYRMVEILREFKRRGCFTVVGGPWVSVQEDYFGELADVIFVGEAEETWPRFLEEWGQGQHQTRYEQGEKTDMSRVPVPRYDLLKMGRYLFGSIQFSRGCPFQCEFCDIIVTFGRRPRFKKAEQIVAELEELRARKMEIVFIVDDNLIGNKKYIREILREVGAWQKRRGFPFVFAAEASLDLAEEEELLQLMMEANILSVFIGVESPNEESLRETKKFQNLSKTGTVLERVHRVQNAGLEVWCGMIVGFDQDETSIFAWQREFLKRSRITEAMVGMLYAIPKTPLHNRLALAGRLDGDDACTFGTNVIPLKMSREELRDGYVQLMRDIYQPEAYFGRLEEFLDTRGFRFAPAHTQYLETHASARILTKMQCLLRSAFVFYQLMRRVPNPVLRQEYRGRMVNLLRARADPPLVFAYLLKCLMHYHHHTMAQLMVEQQSRVVNSYQ